MQGVLFYILIAVQIVDAQFHCKVCVDTFVGIKERNMYVLSKTTDCLDFEQSFHLAGSTWHSWARHKSDKPPPSQVSLGSLIELNISFTPAKHLPQFKLTLVQVRPFRAPPKDFHSSSSHGSSYLDLKTVIMYLSLFCI